MKLTTPFSSSIAFLSVAASVGIATVVSSAAPASAVSGPLTLGYTCAATSPAAVAGCPVGISQFSTVVSAVGTTQALFSFKNIGSAASSITNINIFAKPQFSLANIASTSLPTSAVNFFTGTVNQSQFFSFSIGPGALGVANGINPGDSFDILFNIVPGFQKPFNAVATSLLQQKLSVQLTGAGFNYPVGTDPSTLLVFNSKVKAVPEPITMLGSAAALGFGALMKRRSSKLNAKKAGNAPVASSCKTLA
jgi:hypothetical protein